MIPHKKNKKPNIQESYRKQYKSFFWSLRSKTTIQSKKSFPARHYMVGWTP